MSFKLGSLSSQEFNAQPNGPGLISDRPRTCDKLFSAVENSTWASPWLIHCIDAAPASNGGLFEGGLVGARRARLCFTAWSGSTLSYGITPIWPARAQSIGSDLWRVSTK